ncbi:MAG TPA: zf-HC2 domain-containing protein, partial [Thermoanaerobaculia bacterium]
MEPILRAEAEEARRALRDHPTPEQLVAYRAAELPGEEMERIKDHLALCTECGQLLLDLVRFEEFEPAEEPAALAGAEVEAAWQ